MLVYRLAPENLLKENHILVMMFPSGPRNKVLKRVDMSPIPVSIPCSQAGEGATLSVYQPLHLYAVLTLPLTRKHLSENATNTTQWKNKDSINKFSLQLHLASAHYELWRWTDTSMESPDRARKCPLLRDIYSVPEGHFSLEGIDCCRRNITMAQRTSTWST